MADLFFLLVLMNQRALTGKAVTRVILLGEQQYGGSFT
jgi:hypothetical protein